ncbi:hypothetical protein BKA59DRAFT_451853 [Fusarium tricinctum]|uniref:F-box domain-containing protein n=1 Tax=Fusarium tricinctum TaxID=61284 RepID=A0A8K0SAE8_9HYPO|nr:hypothetical protein BKA59DRAFT_451853 [Fusarium tricinctum]
MTGSLQHLPGEMLDHIASHLDVRDQSNASKTSSAIWFAFSRRLHTSIAFKGNRQQVTAMLLNFLANNNTPRIQEIKKHARSVSFIILADTIDNHHQEDDGLTPSLILSAVHKFPRVFALGLEMNGLSSNERKALLIQAKTARRWTAVTHLRVDLPNPVFQRLLQTSLHGANIRAVDVNGDLKDRHLNLLGRYLPHIQKLRVRMRDPVLDCWKFTPKNVLQADQVCFRDFANLECLILAEGNPRSHIRHSSVRSEEGFVNNVQEFITSLKSMGNLRRLAIEFSTRILVWTVDQDL